MKDPKQKPLDKRSYCERLEDLQESYLKATHDLMPHYIGKDKLRMRYELKSGSEAESVYLMGIMDLIYCNMKG